MRTPQKLLIVSSHFDGEVHITPYHEFLNKPYIKTVKVRSFVSEPLNIVESTTQFVQMLRENKQALDKDHQDIFKGMWKSKFIKMFYLDKIASNVVPHYLWEAKVLKRNPFEKP